MYLEYLSEYGTNYHETEVGFFTYFFEPDVMCVQDIYVKPEFRGTGKAWELFDIIRFTAEVNSCSYIEGYVDQDYKHKERSIQVLKAAGFEYYKETEECIWFRTRLEPLNTN